MAFSLESNDHLAGIHPWLGDLQSNAPFDRLLLFRHVVDTHAAFTDRLQRLVWTDLSADVFAFSSEMRQTLPTMLFFDGRHLARCEACRLHTHK